MGPVRRDGEVMTLNTWTDAAEWLRDHLDGLRLAPARMHDAALGESGAPRYSAVFWAILAGTAYDAVDTEETRTCPVSHGYGDPCVRCDGNMSYVVYRRMYRHPLAAALARLRHAPATSPDWPKPYAMVAALLHCGLDLDAAAQAIGHPILGPDHRKTVEAAFLLALRKLEGRWASGPLPRRAPSEAQSAAEAAA